MEKQSMFEQIKTAVSCLEHGSVLVVNVSASSGEYNGFKYDNIVLDTITHDPALGIVRVRREKVKKAIYDFVGPVKPGDVVRFGFDRFGGIQTVIKV